MRTAATDLSKWKVAAPLSTVAIEERFKAALQGFDAELKTLATANTAISSANSGIAAKKAETEAADLKATEGEVARLTTTKTRHTPGVGKLCDDHAAIWTHHL